VKGVEKAESKWETGVEGHQATKELSAWELYNRRRIIGNG
jgi:hypothetical protein